jgi:hypothetical protein
MSTSAGGGENRIKWLVRRTYQKVPKNVCSLFSTERNHIEAYA